MVDFYVEKLTGRENNPKTNAPWTIDDVPEFWKDAVQKKLDEINK